MVECVAISPSYSTFRPAIRDYVDNIELEFKKQY